MNGFDSGNLSIPAESEIVYRSRLPEPTVRVAIGHLTSEVTCRSPRPPVLGRTPNSQSGYANMPCVRRNIIGLVSSRHTIV